jgi:hypothetical protein
MTSEEARSRRLVEVWCAAVSQGKGFRCSHRSSDGGAGVTGQAEEIA